jgi:hypothetical protein
MQLDYEGVYVHTPFCMQKCLYCDFASYAGLGASVQERYVTDLCREIRLRGQQCPQRGHHFLRGRHPYGFNHGPADPNRDGAEAAGRLAAAGGSYYGSEPGHGGPGQITGFKTAWVLTG